MKNKKITYGNDGIELTKEDIENPEGSILLMDLRLDLRTFTNLKRFAEKNNRSYRVLLRNLIKRYTNDYIETLSRRCKKTK